MEIKPIKTENDYLNALHEIEKLIDARKDTPEGDRFDIIVTLVEAYEENNYQILPPDPVEAIIHQMESQGLSRKDLEPLIGSRARVSEILNRKRSLSLNMIRKLQKGLGISAEILVKPYPLKAS
jgi:HTH-type transcriptional regulator/antitoxin HigA